MKCLRLLFVLLLLSLTVTGCHRKLEPVVPPPQAQTPIISTMPPLPGPPVSPVALNEPKPPAPVVAAAPPPAPPKKHARSLHRRTSKTVVNDNAGDSGTSKKEAAAARSGSASPIGQLSAEDTNVNPREAEQTRRLIETIRKRIKHLSSSEQAARKDDIAAINAFLAQAKQALNSNDLVGAETLANKAKIVMEELLK